MLAFKKPSPAPSPTHSAVTIVDALSGVVETPDTLPLVLRGEGPGQIFAGVTLDLRDGEPHLIPTAGDRNALVNGAPLLAARSVVCRPGETVTVQLEDRLCLLRAGAEPGWPENFDAKLWTLFETATGRVLGQCPPREIPDLIARLGAPAEDCATCPQGLECGFSADLISRALRGSSDDDASGATASAEDTGQHFCPACWLHVSIPATRSASPRTRNSPATRCSARITGCVSTRRASTMPARRSTRWGCPRPISPAHTAGASCRTATSTRRTTSSRSSARHEALDKSYLLAVLTKQLQDGLFRDFGLSFRDDDPTGNLMLNQMRNRLFSALTPEDAILSKTALEGAFYERLRRHGRLVALPRPFVYSIRKKTGGDTSLILYDNAGEHFEPGLDPESSPGALHVARSSGLIFLFDPTSNATFRTRLEGRSPDPQLTQAGRIDQQDTILAEMDVRIKRVLGLPRDARIATPVAVLIGKSDVWASLFDAGALPPPVTGGKLDAAIVRKNSDALRGMLLGLCPGLVGGAEAISENVRYFGVSALGHSPVPLTSGPKAGMLAPDPKKLKPSGIDHAAYWLLSQAVPGVIPVA